MSQSFARILVCLLIAMLTQATQAHAAEELPFAVVVQFDASASELDQSAIRYAIEHELGVPVVHQGSHDAATLWIALSEQNGLSLSLRYQPERAQRELPTVIARLAGNMVRDQAGVLVEQLQPQASASQPAKPILAPPCVETVAAPTQPAAQPAPHLPEAKPDPRWLTTLLVGASFGPYEGAQLTLAQALRVGSRYEVALGVDVGAARVDALLRVDDGTAEMIRVTAVQLTAWLGADMRILGDAGTALKVGAAAGVRIPGIVAADKLSGGDALLAVGPRLTGSFALRGSHSLLMRIGTYLLAGDRNVPSSGVRTQDGLKDGIVVPDDFNYVAQIGYQVGF
jgi:hypothetical protein